MTRTLADLGAVVSVEALELALDDAIRRGLTSVPRLLRRVENMEVRGRRGPAALRSLLADRGSAPPTESALETLFARLIRRSPLRFPVPQYEVIVDGKLIARVDFAYPEARLGIELDGYAYHHGRIRWARDLERRTALARAGWRVMHFTFSDVTNDGSGILRSIRVALDRNM